MPRPNILLLHCHDLGRHLSTYGVPSVTSPHLDALAADGVLAAQMFAAAPQCSPSRAALFTGRWPHANGVLGLTHRSFAWDLHPDERHLAERLRSRGYRTELVGVHHESRVKDDDAVARQLGFDRVQSGGLGHAVADRSIEALHALASLEDPFYLQVGFVEPHRLPGKRDPDGVMGFLGNHITPDDTLGVTVPPYLVDDHGARTELAELQGAIRYMDAAVGRVLQQLEELGIADNTITIFTTDHGLALPRAKCSLYEPGLEIAFIIRWPDHGWSGGHRLEQPLSNVDVVPTLLEALQIQESPADAPVHGSSFCSLLDGEEDHGGQRAIFAEMTYHDYYDPRRSIRTDRWKLIANFSSAPGFMDPTQSWAHRCSVRPASHTRDGYHPSFELYDLLADPWETHDLATLEEYDRPLRDLVARLGAWMHETDDPLVHGAVNNPLHHQTLAALKLPSDQTERLIGHPTDAPISN